MAPEKLLAKRVAIITGAGSGTKSFDAALKCGS